MHNNESHLLMCTVPWSHMTMKWMTGRLQHGCCKPLLHVEASTQVHIIGADGPPPNPRPMDTGFGMVS